FAAADLWVPISTFPSSAYRHQLAGGFQARILAPSVADLPAVRAEVRSRLREVDLASENLEVIASAAETPFEAIARELLARGRFAARDRSDGTGENGDPTLLLSLLIVFGMLLFMALPSLNLINLSISRILERSAEIGVRKSFGASSLSLVGQFVTENLVLTFLGGVLALPLAALISSLIDRTALVDHAPISLGLEAYGAGLLLAAVFGLLSGAYPAWRMSRLHPTEALKDDWR
ncbi:MAG: FtsX-like permease family protein, partial [Holophagales bacterium]|nr:FtsX-like permease family protein [Holophagales bacterium]